MQETSDPLVMGGVLATVGSFALERLGFKMTDKADVKIDIGTDENPDEARITVTWPLPPEPDEDDPGEQ